MACARSNGFDGLRLLLALGIVAFHSYTLSHGSIAGMAWQAQVGARLILPAFFALSGYLVSDSLGRAGTVLLLGPLLGSEPLPDYLLAWALWHGVESPVLRRKHCLLEIIKRPRSTQAIRTVPSLQPL
jgi:peptidoglycan/LPS O-acetylase OafA/YrhL